MSKTNMQASWRPMSAVDLPRVMEIAAEVHAGYFESQEVFVERLALFAEGCWIAVSCPVTRDFGGDVTGETVVGYAFMHPARIGYPPPLNQLLGNLDAQANSVHLHDVALLPAARGFGLGRALVQLLHDVMHATSLSVATLVAVHDSTRYWQACGFSELRPLPPDVATRLLCYGADARYMCCRF